MARSLPGLLAPVAPWLARSLAPPLLGSLATCRSLARSLPGSPFWLAPSLSLPTRPLPALLSPLPPRSGLPGGSLPAYSRLRSLAHLIARSLERSLAPWLPLTRRMAHSLHVAALFTLSLAHTVVQLLPD